VLYSSVIRDRFRAPRFRGDLPGADRRFEDVNPLCGDRIRIEARTEGDRLAGARWSGDCCAICGASADILLEALEGRLLAEAAAAEPELVLERLDADIRPTRMKCVTLPITVLRGALAGREVLR
jgi:nitrogen fixation protein NifU and related proteins